MTFVTTSLKQSLTCCLSRKNLKTQMNSKQNLFPLQKVKAQYGSQRLLEWLDVHLKTSVTVMVTEIFSETQCAPRKNELHKLILKIHVSI